MSRYIDADALIKKLDEQIQMPTFMDCLSAINSAPSIDIVRCKECKYCVNNQCWKADGLDKLDGNVSDDDFCSRGEREGE